jgi:acyl dehydratase
MHQMKLKYKFVLKEISGKVIGIAVGRDNELFNGMVKLNSTGGFIFELLNNQDLSEDQIVTALCEKYDISGEKARDTARRFLEYLRQNELLAE